jgi:hypothetical protein
MNDNWDLREALVAAVYRQDMNLDERVGGEVKLNGLGRCLLNERRG